MTASGSRFSQRVAAILATRVVQFGLAVLTSILISRLLGPSDKGAFVAVTTVPGMLAAIGMFGLPSAVNYYAGRGHSVASLRRAIVLFTVVLSIGLIGVVWLVLPLLEASFLRAAPDDLLRLILITVPASMLTSFVGTLLYGRQSVRTYNFILIGQAAAALGVAIVLVGVLGLGLRGAILGTIAVSIGVAIAAILAMRHLHLRDRSGPDAPLRGMLGYGFRLYPASITGYFNYRADTYLIQALAAAPARALGLYSLAVTIAELVFYVPDSVATMLLPRVASVSPDEADRILGRVGRLTMLVTVVVAIGLVPVALIGVNLVLPAFVDCLPAFLVLLPGVVSLSLAKVMTSYLSGRGRPGSVSFGSIIALVVNVGLNLVLIPTLGIVGASLASLVSYTVQAGFMLAVASRLAAQTPWSLFVPGRAEFDLLVSGTWRALLAVQASGVAWRRHAPQ